MWIIPSLLHTRHIRRTAGALRAHRVIFMIRVLHISNALRPVTTRCGNTNLSPPFCHQDRQSIIPRGREFRAGTCMGAHVPHRHICMVKSLVHHAIRPTTREIQTAGCTAPCHVLVLAATTNSNSGTKTPTRREGQNVQLKTVNEIMNTLQHRMQLSNSSSNKVLTSYHSLKSSSMRQATDSGATPAQEAQKAQSAHAVIIHQRGGKAKMFKLTTGK